MKTDTYKFRIDSFTPDTIPMARLAAYLLELSKLLGSEPSVHFREIKRGSAVLVAEVENVAVPKVRQRLVHVEGSLADHKADDIGGTSEPFRKLNAMLAADNAVGNLRRGPAIILKFPGREAKQVRIGPVTHPASVVGQLVRIGGRDTTAHAQVEDAEGRSWQIVMTREQARTLAPYLYGAVLRFTGMGRWNRTEYGVWELDELKLRDWEQLTDETLRESVTALRGIKGSDWPDLADQVAALERIRQGGDAKVG